MVSQTTTTGFAVALTSALAITNALDVNLPNLLNLANHTSELTRELNHTLDSMRSGHHNGSTSFLNGLEHLINDSSASSWFDEDDVGSSWWQDASSWMDGSMFGGLFNASSLNGWLGKNGSLNSLLGKNGTLDDLLDKNGSLNGSLGGLLGKNGSLVSDTFSASSVYLTKSCLGVPTGIMYSNIQPPLQEDKCESSTGTGNVSIKSNFGVKDVYADAIQRFGCNASFVMLGVGEDCKIGMDILGANATFWVAFLADNVCHSAASFNDHIKHKGNHSTSFKVELKDNQLKMTNYKDANCQQEDETTVINGKSKQVGNSMFCEDGDLYQIYDASGKSSLFNTTLSSTACNRKVPASKSPAVANSLSVLVALVGLVGTAMVHL